MIVVAVNMSWMLESWTDVVGVEGGINKLEDREANLKTSEESCT